MCQPTAGKRLIDKETYVAKEVLDMTHNNKYSILETINIATKQYLLKGISLIVVI